MSDKLMENKLAFEQDVIELLKKHKFLRDDTLNFVMEADIRIDVTVEVAISGDTHKPIITFNGNTLPEVTLKLGLPD